VVDQEKSDKLKAIEKSNRRMAIWGIVVLVIIIPVAIAIWGQYSAPPEDTFPDDLSPLFKIVGWLYFVGLPLAVYKVFEDKVSTPIGRVVLFAVSILIGWVLVGIAFYIMMVASYLIFDLVNRVEGSLFQSMAQMDVRGAFVDLH
jgi:hypothetical protein